MSVVGLDLTKIQNHSADKCQKDERETGRIDLPPVFMFIETMLVFYSCCLTMFLSSCLS